MFCQNNLNLSLPKLPLRNTASYKIYYIAVLRCACVVIVDQRVTRWLVLKRIHKSKITKQKSPNVHSTPTELLIFSCRVPRVLL